MLRTYEYPPMLGSPDEFPVSSPEWIIRHGLRIKIAVDNVEQQGIDRLITAVEKALSTERKPWEVFPPELPCGTPDNFFQMMAGISAKNLAALIKATHPEHWLIKALQVDIAEANPAPSRTEHPGGRGKTVADRHSKVSAKSSESVERILARLARDHPDVLAAYERGDYPSARAAGIAAGIIRPPTPYQDLRRAWKRASEEERERFRKEIAA